MNFSAQQEGALQAVHRWLTESDQQVFRLFGYAGSGKTTLARHFAEGVEGRVMFGSFTGKAAYVMRSKGCPGATTIHKMIYVPASKSKQRLMKMEDDLRELQQQEDPPHDLIENLQRDIQEEKDNVCRPMFHLNLDSEVPHAKLVIIDECSMVDERMANDLLGFGTKVLALGDPAQLPPVKSCGYFTNADPDVMLTEIHRQARGNPIIDLATKVRQKQMLEVGQYGESRVMVREDLNQKIALDQNQIIVGANETRRNFNRRFREVLGHESPTPVVGDRLVCLRNNHEIGLLNGGTWNVAEVGPVEDDKVFLTIRDPEENEQVDVVAHRQIFMNEELPWWAKQEAEEFDYGYALTCHKSQGSQWDKVLVFDESSLFRQNRHQWLYTAITRAAQAVTVVV